MVQWLEVLVLQAQGHEFRSSARRPHEKTGRVVGIRNDGSGGGGDRKIVRVKLLADLGQRIRFRLSETMSQGNKAPNEKA